LAASELLEAVKTRDVAAVRALLVKSKAEVNVTTPDGSTALHLAVDANDAALTDLLLRSGASASAKNSYGVTPLLVAVQHANAEMVDRLLKAGADVHARRPNGETVLMNAARSGNPVVVNQLLARGADPNDREPAHRQTALMWAAADNRASVVAMLIDAGADPNAADALFLQHELAPGEAATPKTPTSKGGMSVLQYAAREGALDAVRVLADKGADLDQVDPDGVSALLYATLNGHTATAALLLEKGADPNIVDTFGRSVVYQAIDLSKPDFFASRAAPPVDHEVSPLELINRAVKKGAAVNSQTITRLPPRHDQGGDDRTTVGTTPLLRAARNADIDGVRLLLELGADPSMPARGGVTPVLAASGQEWLRSRLYTDDADYIDVIKLLVASGADINERNDQGDTPLHVATDHASLAVVKFLAENGAKLDAKDNLKRTALDIASGVTRPGPRGLTYFDVGGDDSKAMAAIAAYLRGVMESRGLAIEPYAAPAKNQSASSAPQP
jgi:ankyrin repeat protein